MSLVKKSFTRRKFLTSLALAGLGGGSYAHWLEPHWLKVSRHEIKLAPKNKTAPLKLLHLSDLHSSPEVSLPYLQRAMALGLSLQPDLICLTGDFITVGSNRLAGLTDLLAPLAQAAPTFACLGNHDGGAWAKFHDGAPNTSAVQNALAAANVKVLHNLRHDVAVRDWKINLTGVGDLWAGELRPLGAFTVPAPSDCDATILLSHNPDTKGLLKPYAWDLMLSGHTHGGQFYLPFIGAPFAPVADKKYLAGLYRWENRWLHITRGVGNLHGLRFNCRPEISLLTLN